MITTLALQLMTRIAALEAKLKTERRTLELLQRECIHQWGPVKYAPKIREAYRTQGDPPGTMGIDWQPPVDVPREETPVWTRQCTRCLKTETTSQTDQHVTKTPRFP